jgi:hypothetical protein
MPFPGNYRSSVSLIIFLAKGAAAMEFICAAHMGYDHLATLGSQLG